MTAYGVWWNWKEEKDEMLADFLSWFTPPHKCCEYSPVTLRKGNVPTHFHAGLLVLGFEQPITHSKMKERKGRKKKSMSWTFKEEEKIGIWVRANN